MLVALLGSLLTVLDIGIYRSNSMPLWMGMRLLSCSKPVPLDVPADRNFNDHAGHTGSDSHHNPTYVDTPLAIDPLINPTYRLDIH